MEYRKGARIGTKAADTVQARLKASGLSELAQDMLMAGMHQLAQTASRLSEALLEMAPNEEHAAMSLWYRMVRLAVDVVDEGIKDALGKPQ